MKELMKTIAVLTRMTWGERVTFLRLRHELGLSLKDQTPTQ